MNSGSSPPGAEVVFCKTCWRSAFELIPIPGGFFFRFCVVFHFFPSQTALMFLDRQRARTRRQISRTYSWTFFSLLTVSYQNITLLHNRKLRRSLIAYVLDVSVDSVPKHILPHYIVCSTINTDGLRPKPCHGWLIFSHRLLLHSLSIPYS